VSDHTHVIEIAIEPRSRGDAAKFADVLAALRGHEPSVRVSHDEGSGQCVLGGGSEEQLARVVGWLREQGVAVNVGAPQVAYLERLGKAADIDYTHKKQTGGEGEFARVKILFQPGAPGSGFVFESTAPEDHVPAAFMAGVEKGLESAKENGPLAGFPLIDFRAMLYDGAYHDVDSSAATFESAALGAFRELREKGAPELLEPIMKVELWTPDEYLGDAIGDMRSRRAASNGPIITRARRRSPPSSRWPTCSATR
jgi:elongation factor G